MNPGQHFLLLVLAAYRLFISPIKAIFFGPSGRCRYTPSCSVYASEAVRGHGLARGLILAACRLARCHPWGGCGCDPVPVPRKSVKSPRQTAPIRAHC